MDINYLSRDTIGKDRLINEGAWEDLFKSSR